MASEYLYTRVTFSASERSKLLAILDAELKSLDDFGSEEFVTLFRMRDRIARCKVYKTSSRSHSVE